MQEKSENAQQCYFCERIQDKGEESIAAALQKKRMIYEDESFLVSHWLDEKAPTFLGLVLIQTKRHVRDLAELSLEEASKLGELEVRISRALKAATGASWTYCYLFLEGYRHVHMFIAARYPGLPEKYLRLNVGDWPGLPVGGQSEVNELSEKLRSLL